MDGHLKARTRVEDQGGEADQVRQEGWTGWSWSTEGESNIAAVWTSESDVAERFNERGSVHVCDDLRRLVEDEEPTRA